MKPDLVPKISSSLSLWKARYFHFNGDHWQKWVFSLLTSREKEIQIERQRKRKGDVGSPSPSKIRLSPCASHHSQEITRIVSLNNF